MPDISSIGGTSTANQDVIRALKDHLHDADYNVWVPSESLLMVAGATAGAGTLAGRLVFANATNNSDVRFKILRHNYWTKGDVRVTLFYNGSTGSTANLRLVFRAHALALGEVNPASGYDINDVVETFAGESVAFAFASHVMTSTLPVDASHTMLEFNLFRDGTHASDTYAGDFMLFGALLTYVPARQ